MKKLCLMIVLVMSNITVAHADNAARYISMSARKYQVSEAFALRVAKIESNYNCNAVGRRGEVGPLQILPATARTLGYSNIRRASCQTKVDAGMAYLARCYHKAGGNWGRAAACHNAGESALKWRRYPASVRKYVQRVVR